jgi:biotin carboxyl carrier protein
MKLELTINGAREQIEILAPAPVYRFRLQNGPQQEAHVTIPEPGIYSILMNGRSYEAVLEETPEGLVVTVAGQRFEVKVWDPRRFMRRAGGVGMDAMAAITAPMPGKVVRVLAAVGEAVAAGQGILVVEAMKMQNEMKAPGAGKVLSLTVREGDTVAAGQLLATIG